MGGLRTHEGLLSFCACALLVGVDDEPRPRPSRSLGTSSPLMVFPMVPQTSGTGVAGNSIRTGREWVQWMPRSLKNPFQTRETNCGPRSDTMSSGMPKYLKTELNINSAVIIAVGRPPRGRSRQDLENRSTITSMHVLPSESGRSVMKSTPRCDHGRLGTGNRRSLPAGKWRGLFEMAQSVQPWTNLLTSLAMFGH